jgi:phage N-6-adenine-methyltransferase
MSIGKSYNFEREWMIMDDMQITSLTKAQQALANAKTSAESKQVEILAATAKAWAKEQGDFEGAFEAACIYIQARCKTTELIIPTITQFHGNRFIGGDDTVTSLENYGFTKKQWERRRKELEAVGRFDEYQDDCIEKRVLPTPFGLVGFCFRDNYHVSDDSYEWYTPLEYIYAIEEVMGHIDLDPASCKLANDIVGADYYYTKDDDGLTKDWFGRVFLNPPYNMPLIEQFTGKAIQEYQAGRIESAIVLVNNATDTIWFHAMLGKYPVCFTRGRVQFTGPDGDSAAGPRQGQAFFYLGKDTKRFASVFSRFGIVLVGYDNH